MTTITEITENDKRRLVARQWLKFNKFIKFVNISPTN
jgi:hypothetical protein